MSVESMDEVWRSRTPSLVDVQVVAERSAKRRKHMKFALVGEFVGGSAAVAGAGWFVVAIPGPITACLLVFCIVVASMSFMNQLALNRSFRAPESVLGHLQVRQKEIQNELVFVARGLFVWRFAAFVLFFWTIWVAVRNFDKYLESPGDLVLGVGGILVILFFSNKALHKNRISLLAEDVFIAEGLAETQHEMSAE